MFILGEDSSLADWDSKLQQTMAEMFALRSEDAAYKKISAMLSTLGDPFTRIISPKVLSLNQFPCLYCPVDCSSRMNFSHNGALICRNTEVSGLEVTGICKESGSS